LQDVSAATAELTFGTWRYQKGWKPLHIVDAEGCFFTDAEGKRYLDFSSQLMCVGLGHKNQAVIAAIEQQARKLPYIAPGYATDVRAELSELLLEVLPHGSEQDCLEIPLVSRIYDGGHWSHRRVSPMGDGAGR
jgi:taurine---2-oxoglutarate transaminase